MPEIPQIGAGGGVSVPQPVSVPRGNAFGEGLEQAATSVRNMAEQLGTHLSIMRRVNQQSDAQSEWLMQTQEAIEGKGGVLNDPNLRANPDAAEAEAKKRLGVISQQVLQKYPLAAYEGRVQRNLEVRTKGELNRVYYNAHANLEQNTRDGLDVSAGKTLAVALSSSNPKDAAAAVNDFHQQLDIAVHNGIIVQGDAERRKFKFDTALNEGMFEKQGMSDPASVMAMTQPPAGISPEKFTHTKALARDQVTSSYRDAEAFMQKQMGDTELAILQAKAQGKSVDGMLEQAAQYGNVSPKFFRQMTGHPYEQTMPGVREQFENAIQNAATTDDLNGVIEQANLARTNGSMSGADMARITLLANHEKGQVKDAKRVSYLTQRDALREEFTLKLNTFEKKLDAIQNVRPPWGLVEGHYNALVSQYKGDAVRAAMETREFFKNYTVTKSELGGTVSRINKGRGPVMMPPPPAAGEATLPAPEAKR